MNKKIISKLAILFVANVLCLNSFAVEPELTDLPFAYGEQLWNSTFDGAWETTNNEPVNMLNGGGWHSFNTATTTALTTSAKSSAQSGFSTNVRPGAVEGSKSARISSREVLAGAIANGNFTTGRINGGSIRAANLTGNYNRTVRNDAAYCAPFESKPDSVAVWVNFKPVNQTQFGRMSIFIHGDGNDFQDPPSTAAFRNQAVAFAGQEFTQTNGEWVRLSIPFDYENYTSFTSFGSSTSDATGTTQYNIPGNVAPKYIIVTMATNKVPGGTVGDTLWIDDFLMIYNPTLEAENTSGSSQFLAGETLEISYTITGTMSPYNLNAEANVVRLELSDATGSFDDATVLDRVTTNESGVFTVALPEEMEIGDGYKLRVVTTNYPMISDEINIEIVDDETVSIKMPIAGNVVRIYPNPVQTTLFVETATGVEKAVIYTANGMKIAEEQVFDSGINISSYEKGTYIIAVETKDGNTHRQLFVKK